MLKLHQLNNCIMIHFSQPGILVTLGHTIIYNGIYIFIFKKRMNQFLHNRSYIN